MSGGLDGVCEAFKTKGEAWRLHADFSKERADAVRKLTGWIRGVEPPPDGATRADALERGPAWSGWPWSIRREGGGEVSPALWNEEREAAADALADLAVKVATEAGKVSDAFHAEERLADLRGEVLTPPREWNSPLLEILRPARDAAEAALDALNEEGAAWREWEAVCAEARRTLPLAEIEAARARLEAETVEQQGAAVVGAVREVGAKVGENGKAKPPARSKDGTAKRKKREAWPDKARDMARAFQRALPSLLPDDSPLNDKGELDARRVVGGWSAIVKCFERWATRNPGLVPVAFPRGAAAVEDALKSLFRALKDSGE